MCASRGMCYNKVRYCNKNGNFGVQISQILRNLLAVGANGAESA